MGAIQQAFNQSLHSLSTAFSPMVTARRVIKDQEKREIKRLNTARRAADKASDLTLEAAESGASGNTIVAAQEREVQAYEELNQLDPSLQNLAYITELKDQLNEYKEEDAAAAAAKKAAKKMFQQQQQYKDQSTAALRETAARRQESAALAAKRAAIQAAEQKRRLNNG